MADDVKVVNGGLAIITNRMVGAGTEPKWVDWGVGTDGPFLTDTAMGSAAAEDRATGDSSRVQTAVANDTYQVVGTLTAEAERAITEAGLFDAFEVGDLFLRGTFSVINLNTDDSVVFTIKTAFSDGS